MDKIIWRVLAIIGLAALLYTGYICYECRYDNDLPIEVFYDWPYSDVTLAEKESIPPDYCS